MICFMIFVRSKVICFMIGNQCGFGAENRLGEGTGYGGIEAKKPVRRWTAVQGEMASSWTKLEAPEEVRSGQIRDLLGR